MAPRVSGQSYGASCILPLQKPAFLPSSVPQRALKNLTEGFQCSLEQHPTDFLSLQWEGHHFPPPPGTGRGKELRSGTTKPRATLQVLFCPFKVFGFSQ